MARLFLLDVVATEKKRKSPCANVRNRQSLLVTPLQIEAKAMNEIKICAVLLLAPPEQASCAYPLSRVVPFVGVIWYGRVPRTLLV